MSAKESRTQLIWTRLTYCFGASDSIFGEDLDLEAVNLLLKGRPTHAGWAVDFLKATDAELAEGMSDQPWQPAFLSKAGYVVVNRLCHDDPEEPVELGDPALHQFLEGEGMTIDSLVKELKDAPSLQSQETGWCC